MNSRVLFGAAGIPYDGPSLEIKGISSHSGRVGKGDMFVAVRGLRTDGHDYVREAIECGAVMVVTEEELPVTVPQVTVKSSRAALAQLWHAYYGCPADSMRLIGVTGTNGKTGTAAMLSHILKKAGQSVGLVGTVGATVNGEKVCQDNPDKLANMTTPDPAELYALLHRMKQQGVRYAVMEVTSHALALEKTAPLRFERGIFTNLTPEHLDFHGSMASYFAEKQKLFAACRGAIINTEDEYGARLADMLPIPVWRVGESAVTHVEKKGAAGSDFVLRQGSVVLPISISLAGEFWLQNAALAASAALSMGVSPETVRAALGCFEGVRGRLERVAENREGIDIFIDYAHTPDALQRLLRVARELTRGRVIAVFGCGGDRDRTKRPKMGRIAAELADFAVVTSDNPRTEDPHAIIQEILAGMEGTATPYAVVENRIEAIHYAMDHAQPGDVIVLCGKGHETYQIIGREKHHLDEREVVAEHLTGN